MDPEKLQQAWQSQSCEALGTDPEQWLKVARFEQRLDFWSDLFVAAVLLGCGGWKLWSAFQDIESDWPWLIYCACLAWVVIYILKSRWRRRRKSAPFDDTVLAHVETSIHDIEVQMRQDRTALWWYLLPIAAGCMIPPVVILALEYGTKPLVDSLVPFLRKEGSFLGTFIFVYVVMEGARRVGLKRELQELQGLRSLRESLLNTDQ